jgi:thiamine kinase-like enzyme
VQRVLSGDMDFKLGELQLDFLRKLQRDSLQSMRYEESRLSKNLRSRFQDLEGHLTEAWSTRLARAMRRIEESLAGRSIPLVAAHNDFTPWNIRVERDTVRVFDWEYADDEQLPLFDLLHFTLMPMALRNRPTDKMVQAVRKTLQLSESWIGKERCYDAETQALAYLVNLCTLYLWGAGGVAGSHPVLGSYALLIDHVLLL